MNKFVSIKKEWHSVSCACELQVDWNIPLISGCDAANGFIVQDYKRCQKPTNVLDIPEYGDIHYFEAWCVKDGAIISEDKGSLCDDMFSIGSSFNDFSSFRQSLDTKGTFEFNGTIYWIPEKSPFYEIVDKWGRYDVKQAAGLKATYHFPELENVDYIFKREPFIHTWNLIGEDLIYSEARKKIFKYCPRNTERDRQLVKSGVADLLGEKYRYLVERIIDDWEQQWIKASQDQEDKL